MILWAELHQSDQEHCIKHDFCKSKHKISVLAFSLLLHCFTVIWKFDLTCIAVPLN